MASFSLEDLGQLPHAAATFGHAGLNPAEQALDERGVTRHVQVTTAGWLPLPFVMRRPDLVAVLPERLARQVAAAAGLVVAEPPFGQVELVEAAWWHPCAPRIPHWPGSAPSSRKSPRPCSDVADKRQAIR